MQSLNQRYPLLVIDRAEARWIFTIAFCLRLGLSVAILLVSSQLSEVSRDSLYYHLVGVQISEHYASGQVDWSLWIDDGWKQFIGLVYFLTGPYLLVINIVNAFFSAAACVLLYRLSFLVTGQRAVAGASAFVFAIFPSAVYFHSLPLKECAAVYAILSMLFGIEQIVILRRRRGWWWIAAGLLLMTGLRLYLVWVFSACLAICLLPLRLPHKVSGIVIPILMLACILGSFYYAIERFEVDVKEYESLQYFDIDRLNYTRNALSRGKSKMYSTSADAEFGDDPLRNAWLAAKGVFFFVVGIDVVNIRSSRQAAAVPEVLLLLVCLPYLIKGVAAMWRKNPRSALPIYMFTIVIVCVYGAAATNLGAMYRWRLQALPCLILIIIYGAYSAGSGFLYPFIRKFGRANLARLPTVRARVANVPGRRRNQPVSRSSNFE